MPTSTALSLLIAAQVVTTAPISRVAVVRVPESGIQPRAAVDGEGVLHVVYFTGDPQGGDLHHVTSKDGGKSFSDARDVNRGGGKAVAIGNVRGAQLALGRGGRVHVVWNGAGVPGKHGAEPMLYTRLEGGEFEPARDVVAEHHGLDGGGAVAADASGNVYVVWHAPGEQPGEEGRRVWLAVSHDDGKSFEKEIAVSPDGSGVCPCCGLGAIAGEGKGLAILFRTAFEGDVRDTMLVRSNAGRGEPDARVLDPWKVPS